MKNGPKEYAQWFHEREPAAGTINYQHIPREKKVAGYLFRAFGALEKKYLRSKHAGTVSL